ncbi:flagellar hook-associated protein FlgK [Falsirhodobacter sp. 20TX0035]|uniref:flagellar hook-associated protein FlgK n=1 Tax=Falsirhodobacter sp. 20TX0035 TaxID=3022019 RepID=UPI00232B8A0E|nr:flagellar hook-associated protein FlgK [Falsirhodobacter sp. 20TX0035]MDB6453944.1 flagellar hook-associated protein FlgK [Falsirhodobacter sp. 20TX0035]
MSLGSALSIAQSGLNAASRSADLTSQNIANALNEGYARREMSLTTRATGGVVVTGVTRFVDQAVTADRRTAEAGSAGSTARAGFLGDLEGAIGVAGATGSLGSLVAGLEGALIDAASQPQSPTALGTAVRAADTLAERVNTLGDTVQAARLKADGQIATTVRGLNTALKQVEALNTQIAGLGGSGTDVTTLQDQRQALVDTIARQIPVREVTRDDGRIALVTQNGATLLDGKAATLSFSPANAMTAGMTRESGALSGLTLNGHPLTKLGDGELAAQFDIRDTLGVAAQADLDAVAQDLTARFADSGLMEAGADGLQVNAALADEPWRLRDGLDAVAEGAKGDATRLSALVASMGDGRGAEGVAKDLLSSVSSARIATEDEASFRTAQYDTLRTAELANGVDTDTEMTNLLVIQQAYSANAKVIQAVDAMMNTLLEL